MARGPLTDQAVPSPVFIQPSASPPGRNVPRIKEAAKNRVLRSVAVLCSILVFISAGPRERLAAFYEKYLADLRTIIHS